MDKAMKTVGQSTSLVAQGLGQIKVHEPVEDFCTQCNQLQQVHSIQLNKFVFKLCASCKTDLVDALVYSDLEADGFCGDDPRSGQ